MKKSKLIFVIVSIIFFLIMIFFVYDFARRTTFPGKHADHSATKTSVFSESSDSLTDKK